MIERVEGKLLGVGASHLLVDVGGIGVRIQVPRSVAAQFEEAKRVLLWTRLIVRDGEPHLYGFADTTTRECFDSLLAVSGVGARIALGILSLLNPAALALAVESGSTDPLVTVPGVGKKLANRIVLELRGRLPESAAPAGIGAGDSGDVAFGRDAVRALTALGYPVTDSREAVRRVLSESGADPPPLDELIRAALIGLNRARR